MSTIELVIVGVPAPRPRPKAMAMRGKSGKWSARVYEPSTDTPKRAAANPGWAAAHAWERSISAAALGRMPAKPWDGCVDVTIEFYLPRPKYLSRPSSPEGPVPCVCKPDLDNLAKSVLDALTEMGLWSDDGCVSRLSLGKWYAGKGRGPGARVRATLASKEPA